MKATYNINTYNKADKARIKFVVRWKDEDGKYRTKFFQKKAEAETWQQQMETELRNQGREVLNFPTALRVMAQECAERLALHGKSLRDATAHYVAYLEAHQRSARLDHGVAEFIAAKRAMIKPPSCHTMSNIKRHLGKMTATLGASMMSDITREDLEKCFADALSISNFNALVHKAREFFRWACDVRHYCAENPALNVALVDDAERPVGVLKPDQIARLLESAPPVELAYFAIGAFAGLRSAEICRLDWSEIDFEDGVIEVPADKAKTAKRRPVKMLPCLRAWLEPLAQKSGKVIPCGANQIYRGLFRVRSRAGLAEWPKNALRHSFCSYHLAAFKNSSELACEMGHYNTKMIYHHYRAVVRESVALQWWKVMPADPDNVLQLALANGRMIVSHKERKARGADGRLSLYSPENGRKYEHGTNYYAKQYGISRVVASKWKKIGKPLDDPEAMARIKRGEYAQTARQQAATYGVSIALVRQWRNAGWPLDDVAIVKGYIEYRARVAKVTFGEGRGRALQVIGLAPRDARAAAPPPAFTPEIVRTNCAASA